MKAIVALLLGVATAWNQEWTSEDIHEMDHLTTFKAWAEAFGRDYADLNEESHRFMVWMDNLYTIGETNSQQLSYKLGLNQFSDMTSDEFKHYVHGDKGACFRPQERNNFIRNAFGRDLKLIKNKLFKDDSPLNVEQEPTQLPATVDWSEKGVVTPVKNQGQCGSCWSFSATGALECNYAIKTGTLTSLSEQQLVDCAGIRYGCEGCNGGQMTGAMRYASNEGGLCSEEEYPYQARGGECKSSSCGTKYDANSGVDQVTPDSSTSLEEAVAKGCVSIGIEADQIAFQHYSSGVLDGKCGTSIDHGVLVVGYGTEDGKDYWKVKNSWGETWGESGYINICRNCEANGDEGECGILMQPAVPEF